MAQKKNILWICTDQQRWDTINALGNPLINTPNIDHLVKSGTAFVNAYTQSQICTPSRVTFLTGLYPAAHQVSRNGNDYFPSSLPLVTSILAENGYYGGLIGKLHLSRAQNRIEKRPKKDGYSEFYWNHGPYPRNEFPNDYKNWLKDERKVDINQLYKAEKGPYGIGVDEDFHQTRWACETAKKFIHRHSDKSWFLSLNVFDPHPPFDPPEKYLKKYDPDNMSFPLFEENDLRQHEALKEVDFQTKIPTDPTKFDPNLGLFGNHEVPSSEMHHHPPVNYDARLIKACYFAMIEFIDDMVGEIVETLEKTGQRENTMIVFMSDHGEMLGDHGLLYKGCRFYEGLVHVPLIFSCPGTIQEGLVANALVELVDLPATLLELNDITIPTHFQSKSLASILTGSKDPDNHKKTVVTEYHDSIVGDYSSHGSMVFDGTYKVNVYHDKEMGEIYDLKEDPDEFHNLWNQEGNNDLKSELLFQHLNAMMSTVSAGVERSANF